MIDNSHPKGNVIFRMSFTAKNGRKVYSRNGKPFPIPVK